MLKYIILKINIIIFVINTHSLGWSREGTEWSLWLVTGTLGTGRDSVLCHSAWPPQDLTRELWSLSCSPVHLCLPPDRPWLNSAWTISCPTLTSCPWCTSALLQTRCSSGWTAAPCHRWSELYRRRVGGYYLYFLKFRGIIVTVSTRQG